MAVQLKSEDLVEQEILVLSADALAYTGRATMLSPEKDSIVEHIQELWNYRELVQNFVIRDLTTRYKQTVLGVAWAVVQPVFMAITFSIFFGRFMHAPAENCPYTVFAFISVLIWQYTSTGVNRASNSLLSAGGLMKRVYFPKLTIPLASVAVPIVDLAVGAILLVLMMCYYNVGISARLLLLPLYVSLMVGTAFGIGLWAASLHVKYRDIHHIVPFGLQLWLFASPVAYSSNIVPEHLRCLYSLNPLVGIIEGARWSLLNTGTNIFVPTVECVVVVSVLVVTGLLYFFRTEDTFADYV